MAFIVIIQQSFVKKKIIKTLAVPPRSLGGGDNMFQEAGIAPFFGAKL